MSRPARCPLCDTAIEWAEIVVNAKVRETGKKREFTQYVAYERWRSKVIVHARVCIASPFVQMTADAA